MATLNERVRSAMLAQAKVFEEYGKGKQDMVYQGVFEICERKVRVRVRRDAFEFQSHAAADLFTPRGWEQIADIHYSKMTPCDVYGRDAMEKFQQAVEADRAVLLERARKILI